MKQNLNICPFCKTPIPQKAIISEPQKSAYKPLSEFLTPNSRPNPIMNLPNGSNTGINSPPIIIIFPDSLNQQQSINNLNLTSLLSNANMKNMKIVQTPQIENNTSEFNLSAILNQLRSASNADSNNETQNNYEMQNESLNQPNTENAYNQCIKLDNMQKLM